MSNDDILKQKTEEAKRILEINKENFSELEVFIKLGEFLLPHHFLQVLKIANQFPFDYAFSFERNIAFILAYMCKVLAFNKEESKNWKVFIKNLPNKYKESIFKPFETSMKILVDHY